MQETVLNFIFKVSCNISCLCVMGRFCQTVCNTFPDQKSQNLCYPFFLYDADKKKKSKPHKSNIIVLLCCSRHTVSLSTNLRCNECERNKNLSTPTRSDWKQKPLSLCYTISAHRPFPSGTWLGFLIVLLRLMYDVSIEPLSQNRTKPESRSKRPTCAFNLDTPSTPRAFFSIPLNCCHTEKLEPVFFPLKSIGACGHFSGLCCFLHGLLTQCLITGDNRINVQLMLQ